MSYSESFPTQRPIFTLDAANAGRLDSRISYSRSTTGTYFGTDKHLSSENLFLQSSDFDTTWYNQGLSAKTGGQTDPSGGTDGFTLVEDGAAAFHRLSQSPTATGELALTVYAKRNSGTRYLNLTFGSSGGGSLGGALATFDLAGGATHTDNGSNSTLTNLSATQTASGNGYYKCVFKATASASITTAQISLSNTATPAANNYGLVYYTGDGTSSIDLAFASLTSTGATDYQATTTQIHREYAPTLQTAAINAPRFEFSATDSASAAMGQSRGLLIEGQSTNLLTNSIDNNVLGGSNNVVEGMSVAPDGTLTAQKIRVDENPTPSGSFRYSTWSVTSGQKYTISYFAKAAGLSHIAINFRTDNSAFANGIAYYNLNTGAVDYSSGLDSYGIESCGNGWYRCWASATATATATATYIVFLSDGSQDTTVVRNGYNGVLLWGGQIENQSFPSSYIATSGSTVTRAADSAAMVSSSLFDTGSGAIICELGPVAGTVYPTAFALTDSSTQNIVRCQGNNGATQMSLVVNADNSGVATITQSFTSTGTKLGVSYDTNSFRFCTDGGTVDSDTAGQVPEGLNRLEIGGDTYSSSSLNGNVKRIAVYSALTDTNLQALTS